MSKFFTSAVIAALATSVAAHTYVEEVEIGGVTYPGFYQEKKEDPGNNSPAWWTDQGWGFQPINGTDINHPNIIAHLNADPSPYTVEAPAGSEVTFTWKHKNECHSPDGEVGWDCSHHGWTATWLAPCHGDCKDVDKTSLEFFKIEQKALIDYREGRYSEANSPREQVGYWATDEIFYDNGNKHTITIPEDIPSGNYVLRTEVASLHNNRDIGERQFWPQAFNIEVTGGKGEEVPEGVKGTEIYSVDDELLKWNIYQHEAGKTIADSPGPSTFLANAKKTRRAHARDFSA